MVQLWGHVAACRVAFLHAVVAAYLVAFLHAVEVACPSAAAVASLRDRRGDADVDQACRACTVVAVHGSQVEAATDDSQLGSDHDRAMTHHRVGGGPCRPDVGSQVVLPRAVGGRGRHGGCAPYQQKADHISPVLARTVNKVQTR